MHSFQVAGLGYWSGALAHLLETEEGTKSC